MSKFQKAMIWLGLTDAEDDEEYEQEPEAGPSHRARHYRSEPEAPPVPRVQVFQTPAEQLDDERGNIRHFSYDKNVTKVRGEVPYSPRVETHASRSGEGRAGFVKPVPAEKPKLHLAQPQRFSDVQEIGDRFKDHNVVVVDMQGIPKELSRRIIDFCAGVSYSSGGRIEKLSDEVLLLSPANAELTANDKDSLIERLGSRTKNL